MSLTILSAQWGNADKSSAVVTTLEAGAVAISQRDRPDEWKALQAWMRDHGQPAALPVAPPPMAVTPRQARLALLQAGLLDQVEAAIAASPKAVQVEWEFANEIRRDHALVTSLASSLNLDQQQVEDLFRVAATL